ncbi:hypothetical protein FYK55_03110 [Roseiconus nitratireducens]|uniref:Uncharacterized protein n=1 Tax=Roseiconus nitratireducens TaxID=2605748 RepID=A0A5M6DEH0_9BACT|nr:hypothetical protein [Roseiconus nitratireducens]KAA5545917.1 hypothetical protein FYK55_03110 [Roseiconus nitratireducens]
MQRPSFPRTSCRAVLTASLCFGFVAAIGGFENASAQNPNLKRFQQQQKQLQRQMEQRLKEAAANQPDLPADPQLLSLHKEYIAKAEKLASEYERKKQYDNAREVYEAMVRLVPNYAEGEAGVQRMLQMQTMKDRKIAQVSAAGSWQDSGAKLQKGMPVHVEVKGTWKVVLETGPEGVQIPDDQKLPDSRIKLGALIGVIADSSGDLDKQKPFLIRAGDDFVADRTGHLFLRMYDVDPTDNQGEMLVLIQSTFGN